MLDEGEFSYKNVTKVIDMGRSGATIAYDYFKEKTLALKNGNSLSNHELGVHNFESSRRIFEYIEDADLWRWRLDNSKAFSSGLKDMNFEFNITLNPLLFQQVNLYKWGCILNFLNTKGYYWFFICSCYLWIWNML